MNCWLKCFVFLLGISSNFSKIKRRNVLQVSLITSIIYLIFVLKIYSFIVYKTLKTRRLIRLPAHKKYYLVQSDLAFLKPLVSSANNLLLSRYHSNLLLIIECRILHKHDISEIGLREDEELESRPGLGIGIIRIIRH